MDVIESKRSKLFTLGYGEQVPSTMEVLEVGIYEKQHLFINLFSFLIAHLLYFYEISYFLYSPPFFFLTEKRKYNFEQI